MYKNLLLCILFSIIFIPKTVYPQEIAPKTPKKAPQSIEQLILEQFPQDPVMVLVARAESGLRQFDKNGNVIVNKETNDRGLFQINYRYHGKTAEKMGLDIDTLEGNIAYTKYLLRTQGLNAWSASAHNWLPHLARK